MVSGGTAVEQPHGDPFRPAGRLPQPPATFLLRLPLSGFTARQQGEHAPRTPPPWPTGMWRRGRGGARGGGRLGDDDVPVTVDDADEEAEVDDCC